MKRWWHEFQHWNTKQVCQRVSALAWGDELCKHIFTAPERTLLWVSKCFWCVNLCWLEGSNLRLNIWVNTKVKQIPRLEEQQNTSKWSLFFPMPLLQLRNNDCKALYQQPLLMRHILPVIKSTNQQKRGEKRKKKLTSLVQPLHLCMKFKIRLIPSWSQLTEPLHICQSRLCKLWSAGWWEEFYMLNSLSLKSIIDLATTSLTKSEKSNKKRKGGKRGHGHAGFSFTYCEEVQLAKEWYR